ncbi:hypothetical protein [Salipaludibacillus daqingensis]|uniref:hypothetical protein n=1 Tax=Salipaludibacillus daqingensis TaxID=3041001 RepID=UPI0024762A10|nr:hypothetical protein [Salipaludibacillus daqingensis]
MNKTTTFFLGMTGGAIGFIYTFYAVFFGTLDETTFGESFFMGTTMVAMLLSTIAMIGAALVKRKPTFSGWLMFVSGLMLPLFISTFGLIPLLFIVPAGLSEIIRNRH